VSHKNRVKIISIDERFLIDVLNWWRNPPHYLALPITEEMPEDCEVLRVWVNHERRCIEALIYSRSFPECGVEMIPQRIPGTLTEMRRVPFLQSMCEIL
jgi:hypothetical protein